MKYKQKINEIIKKNEGIIFSIELTKLGIPRYILQDMVKKGELEKIDRGVYSTYETFPDETFILQQRFPKLIFSHETALFFHELTDVTPITWSATLPINYPVTKPLSKQNIFIRYSVPDLYKLGITEKLTTYDRKVRVYDAEKTLCDIVRPTSNCEKGMIITSFQRYVKSKNCKPYLVYEYAKKLRVEKTVNQYLQILL